MKVTYHIPTEQYGFVEVEREELEPYESVKARLGGPGIPEKEFIQATDQYFLEGTMDAEVYERMSADQKDKIQWAKRAFKRHNRNQND